jgi:hypothetical protein
VLRFGEIVDATFSKKKYQLQGQIYPILYNVSIDPETSHKPDLPVFVSIREDKFCDPQQGLENFFFLVGGLSFGFGWFCAGCAQYRTTADGPDSSPRG